PVDNNRLERVVCCRRTGGVGGDVLRLSGGRMAAEPQARVEPRTPHWREVRSTVRPGGCHPIAVGRHKPLLGPGPIEYAARIGSQIARHVWPGRGWTGRSEEHTSELQSPCN